MDEDVLQMLRQMDTNVLRARQDIASLKAESLTGQKDIEFVSQFGEDLLIWELLGRQTQGFFVEAGAFDGYHYSVSYAFEKMGWTGVLVEPNPEAYVKCNWLRRKSECHNRCLSNVTNEDTTLYVTQDNYGGMLSTTNKESCGNYKVKAVPVKTTTLNSILANHRDPIDFISLDLEGSEYMAVCGLDLGLLRPRIMLIEHNKKVNNAAMEDHLRIYGYLHIGDLEVNQIWVRSDEQQIVERFRWMRK